MVISDGLMPMWPQDICNYDVHTRNVSLWRNYPCAIYMGNVLIIIGTFMLFHIICHIFNNLYLSLNYYTFTSRIWNFYKFITQYVFSWRTSLIMTCVASIQHRILQAILINSILWDIQCGPTRKVSFKATFLSMYVIDEKYISQIPVD